MSISGGEIGVDGGVDDEEVVGSVDLCVGVDDDAGLALGANLSGADVVAS